MAQVPYSSDPVHDPVNRSSHTIVSEGSTISMRGCSPLEKIVQRIVPFALVSRTATYRTSGGGPRRPRRPPHCRGIATNVCQTSPTTNNSKQSTNATCGPTGDPLGKSSYTWKADERNITVSPTTGVSTGAIAPTGAPVTSGYVQILHKKT